MIHGGEGKLISATNEKKGYPFQNRQRALWLLRFSQQLPTGPRTQSTNVYTSSWALAQHINYVIGMNKAIGDRAAIEFAVAFYDALGAGRPVEFAHKFGCAAIRLAGIPEQLTPILKKKRGGDRKEKLNVLVKLIPNCPNSKERYTLVPEDYTFDRFNKEVCSYIKSG